MSTMCSAIASTTGRQCRNRPLRGGRFCEIHEPDQAVEFVGGPEDGNVLSLAAVRGCRNILAAVQHDGSAGLYRPHPRIRGETLGRYRLEYQGGNLVWRWEREHLAVETADDGATR